MNRMVENKKGINRDAIKYIAVVAMLANHFAAVFLNSGTLLRMFLLGIGNFTAITMCYFLVEGYGYTHSKKKYMGRLLLFAIFITNTVLYGFYKARNYKLYRF